MGTGTGGGVTVPKDQVPPRRHIVYVHHTRLPGLVSRRDREGEGGRDFVGGAGGSFNDFNFELVRSSEPLHLIKTSSGVSRPLTTPSVTLSTPAVEVEEHQEEV